MNINLLLYALILTVLPIAELRAGLPFGIAYALAQNISITLIFSVIILLNILVVFVVFFFLDYLHDWFMKNKWYNKSFEKYLEKIQHKVDKFERHYSTLGFIALMIFVAIPIPGTGAWTGTFLAWFLDLDRRKSIIAISAGIIIAGFLVLIATLGFIGLVG